MSKFTKILTVTVYLILTLMLLKINAVSKKQVKSFLQDMSKDCDPKPTDEDFEALLTHERNPSKSAKCLRLCLLKSSSILNSENQLDLNVSTDLFAMVYDDGEKTGGEIVTACNSRVHETELCEKAHLYGMCLLDEMKERNMKIEEFDEE
ncbi:general odorant-binding protein 19d-like [Condylostylus longicornis]|uniref:general odorant-binding protein 19d-like n=1 Tax=Condylostylus longicornis TaxID=2530218 RepID=UPI00244E47DE|nr:general odorant-binding protein 19d-like [Condylostylus longicornis]